MMSACSRRRGSIAGVLCVLVALAPDLGSAQAAPHATADSVAAALVRLGETARRLVDEDRVPGLAIAVVYRDEVVYLEGFGVREEGKDGAVSADTVFQLASLSKPISATVVAAIVGDREVSWDSRIADIDPAFKLHDAYPTAQLTVRDLFAHRSGLPGSAGDELELLGFPREEILRRLVQVAPSSSFRAGYSYSNFGITEGAVAAAKAAGMGWEDAAQAKLYGPLAMTSTSSRHDDFVRHADRAELHARIDGRWQAVVKRDPDAQAPAGGVSSTAPDLAQWVRLVLGRGSYGGRPMIAADAIAETHVPQMARGRNPITGAPSFYGLGWNVEYGRFGELWGHAGAFSVGARTLASMLPDEQLGIIVLTNAFPTGVPEGLADDFFDRAMTGEVSRDWFAPWDAAYDDLYGPAVEMSADRFGRPPANPLPALPLSAYAGTYANSYYSEVTIAEAAGRLELRIGPAGRVLTLSHFDRDLFTYAPSPELPTVLTAVTFAIGPDGKAAQFTIDELDSLGLGVFVRSGD